MDLLAGLREILPADRLSVEGAEIERHGRGMFTYHTPHAPDAVAFPRSREEVTAVLRFASERGVPVVPFGEGSSLEGHTIPLHGGISLDLGLMNNILELRPKDFIARVEPSVTHGQLNQPQGARPLLPGGSRLGCFSGRDGRDERERHERRALRRDARPSPRA